MADTLSQDAVQEKIAGTEWSLHGDAIVRDQTFDDFATALAYVNRVGEAAERENHHPDILIHGWNSVRLRLFTHSAGGITDADIAMAHTLDAVPAQ
jgi:4a-hydroxytetrahydrobiopterin dehydratase